MKIKRIISSKNKEFRVAPTSAMLFLALGYVSMAQAAILADPNQSQKPQVLGNVNGSITVNINSTSSGGISHNKYSQFNIEKSGVILNNSNTSNYTELGGYVSANKNLTKGPAQLIINEVTSNKTSTLNGKIEVSGNKADVIIANPAGIVCDGCGFINTGWSTLTTGHLKMNNGELSGINVKEGIITISGKGMDDRRSDYTALLSNTVKVNSQLKANDLQVMAGQHNYLVQGYGKWLSNGGATQRVNATGLDVAALGGMYANKITLVVEQDGVGINNKGLISADTDLSISTNGIISNTGKISTGGDIDINTVDTFSNDRGTITSAGDFYLNSQKTSNNAGHIDAKNINIVSNQIINTNSNSYSPTPGKEGGMIADENLIINSGVNIDGNNGNFRSNNGAVSLTAAQKNDLSSSTINGSDIYLIGEEVKTGEAWKASTQVGYEVLKAAKINARNDVNIKAGEFYYNNAVVNSKNDVNIIAGRIGVWNVISAKKDVNLIAKTGQINNYNTIFSGSDISLASPKGIFNDKYGKILAAGNLYTSGSSLTNNGFISSENYDDYSF